MSDPVLIAVKPENLAECHVRCIDAGFQFPRDCAAAYVPKQVRAAASPRRPVADTLSDATDSDWVTGTFKSRSLAAEASRPGIFLQEREVRFLTQVGEDLDELNEPARSSASAKLCRRFAEDVGIGLANIPRARWAVFGDGEDGVALVAHARASMRQVSFEFGGDDNTINVVSIDEQMHRFERRCGIDKVMTLAESIAWLNPW